MLSLFSVRRRQRLAEDAAIARAQPHSLVYAGALMLCYNVIGALDIYSTYHALSLGLGEEANPFMRMLMDGFGIWWIAIKIALQILISVMVFWFPHRLVLTIFTFAVTMNGLIVANNFLILGGGIGG